MTEMYDAEDRRLDAAVSLGIITAEQAAQIRALAPQRAPITLPRAFGGSIIAYILGAITVLVAMGWFLADRWDYLGAGGVLAVVTVYGALFTLVAARMRREGFPVAEGLAALLTVAMVPLAAVALSELVPWLPQAAGRACGVRHYSLEFWFDFWACRGLELFIEVSTLAAALVAWRITRFSPFAVVVGAIAIRFVFHLTALAFGGHEGMVTAGWTWVICGSLGTAVAYVVDRRTPTDHDVALWLHLLAAYAAATASAMLLGEYEQFRQLLLPAAALAFTFSLRMRRGVWTLLGLAWFVIYLGWLAAEVFRNSPVFPIVLAALGIGTIVATVWVQRNRERLIARLGGLESGARPSFPGGMGLMLLPAVIAVFHLAPAAELDRLRWQETRARLEAERRRSRREAREARADSLRHAAEAAAPAGAAVGPPAGETDSLRRP